MAQDYYDILQPFDYVVEKLKQHSPALGLEYVAENDEVLLPAYPAVLIQVDRTERTHRSTQYFMVRFYLNLWVFHAELTVSTATRSRKDIQLATDIRKLLHQDRTLGGHVIDSLVDDEQPGISARVTDNVRSGVVTTRLSWSAQNRVPHHLS